MIRAAPLTVVNGGINRLRIKGGARSDVLYDLLNGYVTAAQTVRVRPGSSRVNTLSSSTKGVCSFGGSLHVFASSIVTVPAGFTLHVLTHPDSSISPAPTVSKIHFAAPYLGFLYVVAEFSNGDIFHFWLQITATWSADTIYSAGDVVVPTVPAGILFKATRNGSPFPSWAPRVPRATNDNIEPTTYNGFFYTVTDTVGTNPTSGDTEPLWPAHDGATVVENTEGLTTGSSTTTQPPSSGVSNTITQRYGVGP